MHQQLPPRGPFRRAARLANIAATIGSMGVMGAMGACATADEEFALRELPQPAAEIAEPFSLVSGIVETADGRVLVADALESQLSVVDFTDGSKANVGRQGAGPGEYRSVSALFRVEGDTIWALDAPQQRIVSFAPDLTPGTTFPFPMMNAATSTQFTPPFVGDGHGRVYVSAMKLDIARGTSGGTTAASFAVPDSVQVIRIDPRAESATPDQLFSLRFPVSGTPEMKVEGGHINYKAANPGLIAADAWSIFPDGRIAIVRGGPYTVEFIAPNGTRSPAHAVPFAAFPVTEEDKTAEMAETERVIAEQSKAVQRTLPPGMTISFEITPPASWPDVYPPITPLAAIAAPDGALWVRRAVPSRIGREQWDVIDQHGIVVERWQLPKKVALMALGNGVAYTVRSDEDDLRYVQRIVLPR